MAEKVIYALKEAARRLQHYFEEQKITVVMNHPIWDILFKLDVAGRVTKWALALAGCDFEF